MPLGPPPLDRDQFPVAKRWVYINHAGLAPLPRAGFDAARAADEAWMLDAGEAEGHFEECTDEVRANAAALMGATSDEVAFIKNTTEGLAYAAEGLTWKEGDRIVVPAYEYPSTIFPFLALEDRGVEVVQIEPVGPAGELPLEAFAGTFEEGGVRMVALSWVQYATGWRTDLAALAALAHDHGALVCADVIQGLGVLPCELSAWGVDIAMADGHKWLLGPQGAGVLYVAQRHLDTNTFRVTEPGWNSVVTRHDYDRLELTYDPSARRYEGGTHNLTGIEVLGAGIDLLRAAGADAVWSHVDAWCQDASAALLDLGADVVTTRDPDHRAGILTFRVAGRSDEELCESLTASGVACRPRVGGARVSPHAWNDASDLDRFIEAVRQV